MSARRDQRTLVLGLVITAAGLICLGSGIALLIWQLANPEQAARLPQAIIVTAEATPTPGILGTALAMPPLPNDPAQIAILPVSENASPTPAPSPSSPPTSTGFSSRATETPRTTNTPDIAPTARATDTLTAVPTSITTPAATPLATALSLLPDRILIERIDLNAPIVPVGQHALTLGDQVYSQWDVPNQRAAGWHQNSATLGTVGNIVLNGHHNVAGEVFRYLSILEPGDLITLEAAGRRFNYIVVQTMTLAEEGQTVEARQENARWILPTTDERVTLITCWPYYANTHRLVVIARPLDDVIPPAAIP